MKVLWLCNTVPPQVSENEKFPASCYGGWITGLLNGIISIGKIKLTVCALTGLVTEDRKGKTDTFSYYLLPYIAGYKYCKSSEMYFENILSVEKPDVVHIFGTEYSHTLAMVNACGKQGIISKVLISIQGLTSVCAKHYYAGLPFKAVNNYTVRDFLRQDNIRQQRKSFIKRGAYETEALKKVYHVSGRTDWDRACTSQINPDLQYHFCNEILRDGFYKHSWNINKCERHSIFISQADYPVKGLHIVLEALAEIVKRFPDCHLYVAGIDITRDNARLLQKLKINYYGKYIKKLIKKHQLRKHITFTGILNEKEMCERFLKSHVFVLASSIENSPNSLGEAMILGVPSVSSDVGGVKNLLTHNKEGYIFQHDAPYMLAHYVSNIFADDSLALLFSKNAEAKARITHDKEKNAMIMLENYRKIL